MPRPSRRSLLLVPLAALTVPALVAGFLQTLLALLGRASPGEPHLALVLVSSPLAILLLAVSAALLRARGCEVSALRRDVSATERTLVTLVDTADDAVITTDADGWVTSWNRGAERLYAAPRNAAVGRALTDFVATDDAGSSEAALHRVVGTRGRARLEAVHRRLDGSTFDAAAAFSAITGEQGETMGVSVIVRDVTESNLVIRRLADSQRQLQLITASAADAMFTADDRGRLVSWNPAAERIFGWTEAQAAERTIMDMIVPPLDDETRGTRPVFGMDAWHRLAGRTIAVEGIRACGARFPAELSAATYDHAGRSWFAGFVRDTTDRIRAEALAEELLARYQQLVERMPGVVYRARVGRGTHPDYVSPHVHALLGYSPDEWVATPGIWRSRIHPEDLERVLAAVDTVEARVTEGGVEADDIEYRMLCRDGRVIWVRDHGSATRDRRGVSWNGILFDVTERKSLEAQLVHQAFHDPLTGLANRALLGDRIGHAVRRVDRGEGLVALLMLDLDDFKAVNDTLGHAAGDQLLRAVAERLRLEVRDGSTVARLGGDEFAVLLEDVDGSDGAVVTAERIIRAFDQPFRIGTKPVTTRASVGVAVDTARKRSASWLLRSADLAMYEAKRCGKGRWQLYDPAAYLAVSKRLVLENDLRRAVEREQFSLLYQPVVELATQRIVGAEALLRLNHRTLGLVPPGEFISILESTGLIVEVGAWVMRTAARQGAQWAASFPGFRSMAVNVSAKQLDDDAFPATVAAALREHDIDPRVLLLEVTEGVALDPAEAAGRRLDTLRDLGVRLAVDDFGTGYSSLSYLRRLPVNTLKIDRTFVEGVGDDLEATAVARAIVDLARTLRLTTVAEGIETPDQAAALEAMGCDLGQGYLYARPLPAAELAARLVSQAGRVLVG